MAYGYGYYPTQSYFPQMNNAVPDILNNYKSQFQPPIQNGFIWVENEEAARSYLVSAGNTITLWDSKKPLIYVKSADASGIPSTRVFEYKERIEAFEKPQEHVCSCGDKFALKEDFKALSDKVDAIVAKIEKGEKADE
ncbi:MAG: hypothetical protein J6S23_01660 [Clostridia bacterium]|nr:hypothetical protein [Clostridia bacterium]